MVTVTVSTPNTPLLSLSDSIRVYPSLSSKGSIFEFFYRFRLKLILNQFFHGKEVSASMATARSTCCRGPVPAAVLSVSLTAKRAPLATNIAPHLWSTAPRISPCWRRWQNRRQITTRRSRAWPTSSNAPPLAATLDSTLAPVLLQLVLMINQGHRVPAQAGPWSLSCPRCLW